MKSFVLFLVLATACTDQNPTDAVPSNWSVIDDCGEPPAVPAMTVISWPASEACVASSEYSDWEAYARSVRAWSACAAQH